MKKLLLILLCLPFIGFGQNPYIVETKNNKSEIKEKGSYVAKSGRTITKLGVHDKLPEAGMAGNEANRDLAKQRASDVWPIMDNLLSQGLGYRGIARELNKMQVAPPARRQNPDRSKKTEWYASSVRNYILRMKENN